MEKWVILSAISTAVIAGFSLTSFIIAKNIKAENDEYQRQVADLFQAIVISNMLSIPGKKRGPDFEHIFKLFHKLYDGDTKILPMAKIFDSRG